MFDKKTIPLSFERDNYAFFSTPKIQALKNMTFTRVLLIDSLQVCNIIPVVNMCIHGLQTLIYILFQHAPHQLLLV